MTNLDVRSPGPVQAQTPIGTLNAGSMVISTSNEGEATQLIFKNGVKLIYDPKLVEE
jgi:lipopolysaccharide export system protein LptC